MPNSSIAKEVGISNPTVATIIARSPEATAAVAAAKAARAAAKAMAEAQAKRAYEERQADWRREKAERLEQDKTNIIRWRADAIQRQENAAIYRAEGLYESAAFELKLGAQNAMLADWLESAIHKNKNTHHFD